MSLITSAFADGASASQKGGSMLSMLPMIILLVAFMYFMVIRPQSKRAKDHKNLIMNLQVGDEVVTVGGIAGTVENLANDFVVLTMKDNSSIFVQKAAIATILPRGTIKGIKIQ